MFKTAVILLAQILFTPLLAFSDLNAVTDSYELQIAGQYLDSIIYTGNYDFADSVFYYCGISKNAAKKHGTAYEQAKADEISGSAYYLIGRTNVSINYLSRAVAYYQQISDTLNIARTLLSIGESHLYNNNKPVADSIFTEIEHLLIQQDSIRTTDYLNSISVAYRNNGYYDDSIEYLKDCTFFEANDQDQLNRIVRKYMFLGNLYSLKGDYVSAIKYYNQMFLKSKKIALPLKEKLIWESTLFNNLGNLYSRLGEFLAHDDYLEVAKKYYREECRLTRDPEIEYGWGCIYANNNIGKVFLIQNKLDSALIRYQDGLNRLRQIFDFRGAIGDRILIGDVLQQIGTIHKKMGHNAAAGQYYHRALKIQRDMKNIRETAVVLNGLGDLYLQTGRADSAWLYLSKARRLLEGREINTVLGKTYQLFGEYYLKANDILQSRKYEVMADSLLEEPSKNLIQAINSYSLPLLIGHPVNISKPESDNRNYTWILLLLAAGLMAFAVVFIFKLRRQEPDKNLKLQPLTTDSIDPAECDILEIKLKSGQINQSYFSLSSSGKELHTDCCKLSDTCMSLLLFLALEREHEGLRGSCWLDHPAEKKTEILEALQFIDNCLMLNSNYELDLDNYEDILQGRMNRKKVKAGSWIWDFENTNRKRIVSEINKYFNDTDFKLIHIKPIINHLGGRYCLADSITTILIEK
ncbi:MAG: tetratricopeptide repeat protein [FCB group bacterium]|nr:tetratricopeptide repeat protein [FCB group bacterium]